MDWKIVQCCEAGKKHERSACQDNCFKYEDEQFKVMALCDGTSDAKFSELGSKYTAEFSVRYMKEHFEELYETEFSKMCKALINYHQQLLLYLSKCAEAEKGIRIVVDRTIISQELRKFCTTVQVFAVKNGQAIYFKVGNGSAICIGRKETKILSDSSTESPTKHVTLSNTLSVLECIEFKCFELNEDDQAVVLMTDGVEYPYGLFYNHELKPEFDSFKIQIKDPDFSEDGLREYILQLKESRKNTVYDDIGISVLYAGTSDMPQNPYDPQTYILNNDSAVQKTEAVTNNMETPGESQSGNDEPAALERVNEISGKEGAADICDSGDKNREKKEQFFKNAMVRMKTLIDNLVN